MAEATAPVPEKKKIQVVIPVKELNRNDNDPRPSPGSIVAFEWTLNNIIRSDYADYKINLVHVYCPDQSTFVASAIHHFYTRACVSPDDFIAYMFRAVKLMKCFVKRCSELGIACDYDFMNGAPHMMICAHAKSIDADLLVVGSSRENDIFQRSWSYQNITKYCTDHSPCPVIIVKGKGKPTTGNPVDAESLASRVNNLAV